MIEELEYLKYISKVDLTDIMIRAEEARKYKGDDAIAYALAAGIRLGIKAVLEEQK